MDALALLQTLHARRNYRPVADTVTELLSATRAHVGFVFRPAGEQVLANILIAELARQYEVNGGMSFRGFVEELRDQADEGRLPKRRFSKRQRRRPVDDRPQGEGTRVPGGCPADMTAKLRERTCRSPDRQAAQRLPSPPRTLDADRTRRTRTARSVCVTRPRASASPMRGGDPHAICSSCRLSVMPARRRLTGPLNRAMYPPMHARRSPVPDAGLPPFKKDSVFKRPDDDPFTSATVQAGLHRFGEGDEAYLVVWWGSARSRPRK